MVRARPRRAPCPAIAPPRTSSSGARRFSRGDGRGDRSDRSLGPFQCGAGRRHAARGGGDDDAIAGEIIPSDKPGMMAMALRQPVGVVLGLAPWNAPVILGVRAVAMPLACGNTVVLKGSEICPRTHRLIGEAFRAAGLRRGRRQCRQQRAGRCLRDRRGADRPPDGAPRQFHRLDPRRPACRRARRPLSQAGPARTRRQGALLVLDDADLDEAVAAAAFGAFMNQGQICMSTERIVVDEKRRRRIRDRLAAKAATLVAGDPRKARPRSAPSSASRRSSGLSRWCATPSPRARACSPADTPTAC